MTERIAHWIARRFLRGRGLEIGALACPMPVAPGADVLHLDRLDPALQARHYPEVTAMGIREPDLVGEGDDLSCLRDASFDFLIASHLLEHVANPLRALMEWHRVLKPDGVLLLVVPDKRHTFDRDRERTPLGHLVWHLHEGRRVIESAHFLEWAAEVEKLEGEVAAARARELEVAGYAVHAHVWIDEDLDEILDYLARSELARFEVTQRFRGPEMTYHLVKPGPGSRRLRRLRVLAERALLIAREEGIAASARRAARYLKNRGRVYSPEVAHLRGDGAVSACARIEVLDLPRISILTPVKDPAPEHLEGALDSVRDQSHGRWEHILVDDGSRDAGVQALLARARRDGRRIVLRNTGVPGISGATQRALEAATGSHVVLLDHDDRLHPAALESVARTFWRGASYVYSDHDLIDPRGRRVSPQQKPAWSPELLLSTMYPGHLQAFERDRLLSIGGFRTEFDGSQDYDVALRYTEGLPAIEHLPRVLHHWRQSPGSAAADPGSKSWAQGRAMAALREALARRGRAGQVTAGLKPFTYRVAAVLDELPTVTAVLDASEAPDVTRTVLALAASDPAPCEILVIGAGRSAEATTGIPVTHFSPGAGESLAAALDRAASAARGDVILFVRGKVDLAHPGWMRPLLEQVVRPEVGLVGPRLTYPRGPVEFSASVAEEDGRVRRCRWGGRAQPAVLSLFAHCVREVTTIPAVGMMIRRAVWKDVGGFGGGDLIGDWLDVDLGFRIRWSGLLALYEPHAELHWCEPDPLPGHRRREQERLLADRWGVELSSDPHQAPEIRQSWLGTGSPPGPTPPEADPPAPASPAGESSAAPARAGYASAPAPPP